MAIASSLLGSPQSWLDRLRQPVFIATALSLGAHGAIFAAAPLLSAGNESTIKEPDPVPVVTLSPEESLRLPSEILNGPSDFFGTNPLVTQDGDSLLPVPGIPPYGDLAGLGDGSTAPLWGSPLDVFSLPGSSTVFDGSADYDFGDSGFGMTFGSDDGGAINFADSGFGLDLSDSGPAPQAQSGTDDSTTTNGVPPDLSGEVAEADRDLLGTDAAESSAQEPLPQGQAIASAGGTTVDNVFGGNGSRPGQEPDDAPVANNNAPDAAAQTDAAPTPAQRLALENQQRREALRLGYTNNGAEAVDGPTLFQQAGDLAAQANLALQSQPQTLSVQFPDAICPAQVRPAQLSTTVFANGAEPQVALVQSTQYPALDEAAAAAAAARAAELETPGVYLMSVNFHDDAGRCYAPSRGSDVNS